MPDPDAPLANDAQRLDYLNNRTVEFDGKTMDLYEATQHQRYIERQIRRWKREASAMEAAGLDNSFASGKVREWQSTQREFISQTGLRRDYFRERAGKQNLETPSKSAIIKQLTGKSFSEGNPGVPRVASLPDGTLPQTASVDFGVAQGVVPKGSKTSKVRVLAGSGTSTALRDISRLDAQYGGDPAKWQKITGTVEGASYRYEVHWYENDGSVPPGEVYTRRVWLK